MIEQGINELFDLQTLEGQKQAVLAILRNVSDEVSKLNNMKVGFGNSADKTKDIVSGVNNLGTSVSSLTGNLKEAEKAQRDFSKAAIDQIKIAKEQSIIQKNNAAALALEAKAQKELAAAEKLRGQSNIGGANVPFTHNLDALEKERLQLSKTGTVINEIEQAEADAAISAIEWANAQKQVTTETKTLQKTEAELAAEREAAAILNENTINQQKILVAELAAEIKNMTSTQLKSNYGQQLVKDFELAKAELTALEVQGGVAVKASEKAASTTINIFQKSFGALRQLANILPGIGVAGLIAFATEPIIKWVTELFKAKDATDQTRLAQNTLNESLNGSGSGFAKATELVDQLRINIDLAKQGFLDKDKVVKEYNDTIGKTTGKVNDLKSAEIELQKNADAYVKMTLYKSAATLALQQASEKALKAAQDNLKKENEFVTGTDNATSSASLLDVDAVGAGRDVSKEREQANRERGRKRKEALVKESEDAQATFERIAKDFQTKAAKIAKDNKFDLFGGTEDDKTGENKSKKRIEAEQKAMLELLKFRKEQEADYEKEISGIEFLSAERRVEARKKQAEAEKDVLDIQARIELSREGVTGDEIKKIHEKLADDRIKKEAELTIAIIAIRKNAADVEKQIEKDATAAFEKEEAQRAQARKDAAKAELDAAEARNGKRNTNLNTGRDIALTDLEQQRSAGLVTEEQYQQKRLAIEQEYDNLIIKAQIDLIKETIAIRKAGGEDVTDLEEKIRALELKALKGHNDAFLTEQKRLVDERKKLQESLVNDVVNAGFELVSDSYEKQKNAIQDQIDMLEARKQKEIEVANSTISNEQDRAAAITTINARAAAQREQLEARQRKIDQDRARFEKLGAELTIGIETAKKVFQIQAEASLLATNPVTASLAPFALAQIPFVVASGAIAAALIAAKPVPKYKHGTDDHAGGYAVVGDGGKKELVELPSGDMYVTSNKPELMYLPEHSKVLPDAEAVMNDLQGMSYKRLRNSPDVQVKQDFRPLLKELKNVQKAIERNPTIKNIITHQGIRRLYDNGQREITWINRNMQS